MGNSYAFQRNSIVDRAGNRLLRRSKIAPTLAALSDEELAAKAASGSADHFEALVRRYSAAMYRFTYRLSGNRSAAEDIVQETFIKLFRALPKANLDLPLRPWLYKIALNTSLSYLRKHQSHQTVPLEDVEVIKTGDSLSGAAAAKVDAEAALAALSPEARQIVILRGVEDLPFSDIAEILEIGEATARTRFHRAKALLLQHLSK